MDVFNVFFGSVVSRYQVKSLVMMIAVWTFQLNLSAGMQTSISRISCWYFHLVFWVFRVVFGILFPQVSTSSQTIEGFESSHTKTDRLFEVKGWSYLDSQIPDLQSSWCLVGKPVLQPTMSSLQSGLDFVRGTFWWSVRRCRSMPPWTRDCKTSKRHSHSATHVLELRSPKLSTGLLCMTYCRINPWWYR